MNTYDSFPYRKTILDTAGMKPLTERLGQVLSSPGVTVLAVDGDSASGKSTLAEALKDRFGGGIIHMDDFFLPPELRTDERLSEPGGNVHYERFIDEILPKLREPSSFRYRTFDCSVMDYGPERIVDAGTVRIVEGAYSLHPLFHRYYDLSLFLSISSESQSERIRKRNGAAGAERFLEKWVPLEKSYQRRFSIPETSDMLIRITE